MNLWFLRHGESLANKRRVFAGQRDDCPLTRAGRQQAEEAALLLPDDLVWIITSPLKRATETAEIIAATRHSTLAVEVDDRFTEYDMGAGSGLPKQAVSSKQLTSFDGAEDPVVFLRRVQAGLLDLSTRSGSGLVVAHACVGRAIDALVTNHPAAEFYDLPGAPNAAPYLLNNDLRARLARPLHDTTFRLPQKKQPAPVLLPNP